MSESSESFVSFDFSEFKRLAHLLDSQGICLEGMPKSSILIWIEIHTLIGGKTISDARNIFLKTKCLNYLHMFMPMVDFCSQNYDLEILVTVLLGPDEFDHT